jgi:transcriptional/translational regulatory protein YebC/TACO1
MSNKDWEDKFEMLMKHDLIDVPDDFYDEQLYFTDPHDLNNIFTDLEEKNLFLIHMR